MICPGGQPFLMYHTPEMVGTIDQLKEVSQQEIDACSSECVQKCYPCDKDVKADPNILNGDIVALVETRLVAADQNTKYSLPGFQDYQECSKRNKQHY